MPEINSTGSPDRSAGNARHARFARLRPFLTAIAALSLIGGGTASSILAVDGRAGSAGVGATGSGASASAVATVARNATSAVVIPNRRPGPVTQTPHRDAEHAKTVKAAKPKTTHRSPAASRPTYRGTNHVWIPSLGVNRSVGFFSCSRSAEPSNYVYRWGCAGRNNVYLLGHAWGVFKPLHDAYYNGRLRAGMQVVYADGSGRVHAYRVQWWKVVAPTTAASWAWASLSRPGMTLQTCIGSKSQYRLMVRLSRVW